MSVDGLSRGVPVQDQLENQCPSVLFMVNEVTGEVTSLVPPAPAAPERPPARRGRPTRKEATDDTAAQGEGE